MKRKGKLITAAELIAELEADPEYMARMKAKERLRLAMTEVERRDAGPVTQDLRSAGFEITHVYDLYECGGRGRRDKSIPILLEHLDRPCLYTTRSFIAGALRDRGAVATFPRLLAEFRRTLDPRFRATEVERLAAAYAAGGVGLLVDQGEVDRIAASSWNHYCDRLVYDMTSLCRPSDLTSIIELLDDSPPDARGSIAVYLKESLRRRKLKDPLVTAVLRRLDDELSELFPETYPKESSRRQGKSQNHRRSKRVGASSAIKTESILSETSAPGGKLHETSTNLEIEDVLPILLRLSERLGGMTEEDSERIAQAVGEMEVDETREWTLVIQFDGAPTEFRVQAFMDDVDSPDLYFLSESKELINEIAEELMAPGDEMET